MAASAAAAVAFNGVKMNSVVSQAYLDCKPVKDTRALISELCRHFYTLGWVSGTGGSITIKVQDDSIPRPQQLILMSPSGVQKERMEPEDMYVLSANGSIISSPSPKPYPHKPPKCSDCAPLFMKSKAKCQVPALRKRPRNFNQKAYEMRNAGAVIHSHGIESCLATMINPQAKEFRITHMEMIKGIQGHGYYDELVVPIIENTAYESELTESLAKAIEAYPKATAVLVRNHGIYVWGDSWINAKTQLLTRLLLQVEDDLEKGIDSAVPIPSDDASKEEVVAALVTNVEEMIKADRKITALKQLQGHIWRTGFENNELEGVVFEDVPGALEKWHSSGIKVYIYSSGSRLAQRLIFGNTKYGNLRKYLSGFFDTAVGNKRETKSYIEIFESLGVDKPSEILFVTDVFQEAVAAKAAGLDVVISIRPGNGPLPENHGFKTINSFSEI
ncbi:probable bifunctional methylthioribulose-1-phosphate dehydratase/enolase-phosphatase E1 [Carica papaya]|uniref:probable bifunctional methylthioribulose-1-phosphate dehydratase/enolase-phosphatase E1 n=1 Tax=Carica papaya TaxID=3649 RepID=UPI000B8CCEAE|nr:probable bifunctional methylthioribulose-1-phosphate dehydratase/enolase-phosphatase E1 [Carica papaya]